MSQAGQLGFSVQKASSLPWPWRPTSRERVCVPRTGACCSRRLPIRIQPGRLDLAVLCVSKAVYVVKEWRVRRFLVPQFEVPIPIRGALLYAFRRSRLRGASCPLYYCVPGSFRATGLLLHSVTILVEEALDFGGSSGIG
jgi:hypothetical protein